MHWKVIQVNISLRQVIVATGQPQTDSVVWTVVLQAVVADKVKGGQLNLEYSSDPNMKPGDLLSGTVPAKG